MKRICFLIVTLIILFPLYRSVRRSHVINNKMKRRRPMFLQLIPLTVLMMGLWTGTMLAESPLTPSCLMHPDYFEMRFPECGFTWLPEEGFSGKCDTVPASDWIRKPSGASDLLVYTDGPGGSGHYWSVTVGIVKRQYPKVIRGFCLTTWTVGWRTLLYYKGVELPWLDDLDNDGNFELIIWDSFPLCEEPSMSEYGLVVWVYRLTQESVLVIDWELSRQMAREIAEAYRSPLPPPFDQNHQYTDSLRIKAADALLQFANERCTIP
jgi:hypothetical protein